MSICKNNSYISSIILLLTSILYLYLLNEKWYLGVIVLLLGLTSVKHHSRLDKWIIRDLWCYLDLLMVFIFFCTFSFNFKNDIKWILLILLSITLYIYINYFCIEEEKPFYHSLIHYLVIFFLISDIYLNYRKEVVNNSL